MSELEFYDQMVAIYARTYTQSIAEDHEAAVEAVRLRREWYAAGCPVAPPGEEAGSDTSPG